MREIWISEKYTKNQGIRIVLWNCLMIVLWEIPQEFHCLMIVLCNFPSEEPTFLEYMEISKRGAHI